MKETEGNAFKDDVLKVVREMKARDQLPGALATLAIVLQEELAKTNEHTLPTGRGLSTIMQGVVWALEDWNNPHHGEHIVQIFAQGEANVRCALRKPSASS